MSERGYSQQTLWVSSLLKPRLDWTNAIRSCWAASAVEDLAQQAQARLNLLGLPPSGRVRILRADQRCDPSAPSRTAIQSIRHIAACILRTDWFPKGRLLAGSDGSRMDS